MIIELKIYVNIISLLVLKSRFRGLILILNTYVYLLLAIEHNTVIPDYEDITLHIFFLVLLVIKSAFRYMCFPVFVWTAFAYPDFPLR